jgi:hypothetical protein
MHTMQATVNPRLLTKANRLFTGTLQGRIIEILQNARRAGATNVEIANHDGYATVRDNGTGVDDFARLLDLGGSGWDDTFEESEDPAGVGLFCLAPRDVLVRSRGLRARITGDGWIGAPIMIQEDSEPIEGALLQFRDEEWTMAAVERLAVFTGMRVTVDGQPCAQERFVTEAATHFPALGCRIEVCEHENLPAWHRSVRRTHGYSDNVLVNFHGQTTSFDFHPVSARGLWYLVDLTGESTGIRLMLPARTRVVENETLEQLKAALELEAYKYVQHRGHHRLPYKEYLRARELGIELPEATPTFQVGLLATCEAPEPVDVTMPEGFPLKRCYRFDPDYPSGTDTDEANVHLLAALGQLVEPLIPVSIRKDYNGYSWTKLPTIGKVSVTVGKAQHTAGVWSGTLTCVDELAITVATSDGREFSSPVCMAKVLPPEDASQWVDDHVLVTSMAQERLCPSEIWYHFGGWYDEGDTYDTQLYDFERELDRFWADMLGPEERLRRSILDALQGIGPAWKFVKVFASGEVRIRFHDGSVKNILPVKSHR